MSTSFLRRYELFVKTGLFAFVALGFFLVAHPSYAVPSANISLDRTLIMDGESTTVHVSSYHAGEHTDCTVIGSADGLRKHPSAYKAGGGAFLNVSYTVSPHSTGTYWVQCCGGSGNCNSDITTLRVDAGVTYARLQSHFNPTRLVSAGSWFGVCMVIGDIRFSKTVSGCVITPNPPDTYSNLGAVGCWDPDYSKCAYTNIAAHSPTTSLPNRWTLTWGGYPAVTHSSGKRTLTMTCDGLYGKVSVTKETEDACPSSPPPPPPPVYTCTGALPANSVMWDAEESSSLSSNTARSYASSDTATKCQYHCSSGYTWNSSTGTCNLPLTPTLAVCPPTLNLTESGADGNLTAWYSPNGAISCSDHSAAVDVTGTAAWSSTDDSIAQVSGGTVSPVGAGNVSVTATYNGLSDFSSVAVALLGAPDLVVCPSTTLNLVEGGANGSFTAWYSSSGAISCSNHSTATDVTSDLSTTWTSADEGVVTVNNGTVVPVGAGSHVAITAEYTGGASPVSDSSSASVLPVGCIPDTSCAANTCVGLTCVDPVCGSSVAGTKSCSSSGGGYKEVSP